MLHLESFHHVVMVTVARFLFFNIDFMVLLSYFGTGSFYTSVGGWKMISSGQQPRGLRGLVCPEKAPLLWYLTAQNWVTLEKDMFAWRVVRACPKSTVFTEVQSGPRGKCDEMRDVVKIPGGGGDSGVRFQTVSEKSSRRCTWWFAWKMTLKYTGPLTSQTVYYSLLSRSHGPHGRFLAADFILHVKLLALTAQRCSACVRASFPRHQVETTWAFTRKTRCLANSQKPSKCSFTRLFRANANK